MVDDLDALRALFATYDGKSIAPFRAAARRVPRATVALLDLCALAREGDEAVELGATWVAKHLLEKGVEADRAVSLELLRLLSVLTADMAIVHVLQCLPRLSFSSAQHERLHRRLEVLRAHPRPFVRAWAYNGYALLARADPRYAAETEALFESALASEAASVCARIRNARKGR